MKKVIAGKNALETIAHMFAHQTQDEAKNTGHNFFFEDQTLYSYGRHFIIARHTEHNGKKAILFTLDTYSVTTAKQIGIADRAIPGYMNKIYCPAICSTDDQSQHENNIVSWQRDLKFNFSKLATARKKEIYIQKIQGIVSQLKIYLEFFKLPIHDSLQKLIDDASPENFTEFLQQEAERIKYEEKQKQAAAEKRQKTALAKWRKFETNSLSIRSEYDYLRILDDKQRVETSQGVEVPMELAKRFYYEVKEAIKAGGCNGDCNKKFMDIYDVREINENYISIGCHKITIKEIDTIAKKQGWQAVAGSENIKVA